MEKRSYKDRIERFFREKNNAAPSPQERDDIFFDEAWEAIAPQIKVENESPNWGLWSAYFVLIGLMILTPFQHDGSEKAVSKVEAHLTSDQKVGAEEIPHSSIQEQPIEAAPKETKSSKIKAAAPSASEDQSALPQERSGIIRKEVINKNESNNSQVNFAITTQASEPVKSYVAGESMAKLNVDEVTEVPQGTSSVVGKTDAIRNTFNTAMLADRMIPELRVQQLVLSGPFQSPIEMESATASSHQFRFGFYAQAGQTQWWKRKEQNYSPNSSYHVEGGPYAEFGIEAQYMVNKNHGIGLEIGMANQMMQTNYLLAVNYSSQGEFSDGQGNLHNVYQHTLPTILGDVGFNHVLYREPNHNIQEGQEIKFELNLEHEIRSVPLRVAYLHERSLGKNWNLNIATGLAGQIIYKKRVAQSTELISHHSDYHHNYTESTTVKNKSVRDYSINGQLRLGISYDLGNYRIGLQGEIQETLQEAQLHANHYLHPTIITGRLSILRSF